MIRRKKVDLSAQQIIPADVALWATPLNSNVRGPMNIRRIISLLIFATKYGVGILGPFVLIALLTPNAPRWAISFSLLVPFLLIVVLALTRNLPYPNWKTRLFVSFKISVAFLFWGIVCATIYILFREHGL